MTDRVNLCEHGIIIGSINPCKECELEQMIQKLEEGNKRLKHEIKELNESLDIAYMRGYEKGKDLNNAN